MDTLSSISFAKQQGFYEVSKEISYKLNNLFNSSIGIKPGIQMLIYASSNHSKVPYILSLAYYLKAIRKGIHPFLVFSRNENIADEISKRIYSLRKNSIVIVNLENKMKKINGLSFRKFCKANNIRFIVTPSLGFVTEKNLPVLIKALNVDYNLIHKKALRIKSQLLNKKILYIRTKAGTDLKVDISLKTPLISSGIFEENSLSTNLPGGEIYYATKRNGVNGRVVIDGSLRTPKSCKVVNEPVELIIEKGRIVSIKGKEGSELVKSLKEVYLKHNRLETVYYIGEVGIGLNPVSNIIGATILDEKVLGTAHIAIGSNVGFGGSISAPIHLDQVFKNPEIFADGEKIIF